MKYELPTLPERRTGIAFDGVTDEDLYDEVQMRQYAEQAVAPLLAEIERLELLAKEEYESGYEAGQESMRQRLS